MEFLSDETWPSFGPDLLPWLGLGLVALVYRRGFKASQLQSPDRFPRWRAGCFVGGLVALGVALLSPIDALAPFLLVAHMAQHLLLSIVVPPLLLLGAPPLALLRGLPRPLVRAVLAPVLAHRWVRKLASTLVHPAVAWLLFVAATMIWHTPALYQRALGDPDWHAAEHASFLVTGLLFWWPVVQPWPSVPRWPRWAMVPYLLAADLANTILAALFVFRERVFYPHYAEMPRVFGLDVLGDQVRAGALMWVVGSGLFLVPVFVELWRLLSPVPAPLRRAKKQTPERSPRRRTNGIDLLKIPVVGAMLRALGTRRLLQGVLCALAAAVVLDGLFGPGRSAANLAGVLPWTWWRALLFISLLAAGNVFCGVCPFLLPRDLARRLVRPRRRWPLPLRRKWIATGLLGGGLVAYEVFDLWDDPRATAVVVLAYFAAALVVDALFEGASFCKWICPIGQTNFVASTVSPLEIRVRDAEVCAECTGRDCLKGGPGGRGCELELYLPTKQGNLDCTFCLDCVRACPSDNVALATRTPGAELAFDGIRSSIGRLRYRPDFALLFGLFVFGAIVNAAGMIAPIVRIENWIAETSGGGVPPAAITIAWMAVALLLVAPGLALAAAGLARWLSGSRETVGTLTCAFLPALVPLGFAVWLVHFGVHFATGAAALLPVAGRAFAAAGGGADASALAPGAMHFQHGGFDLWIVLVLDVGLVAAALLIGEISKGLVGGGRPALKLAAPFLGLALLVFLAGCFVLLSPMEMRGMAVGTGLET